MTEKTIGGKKEKLKKLYEELEGVGFPHYTGGNDKIFRIIVDLDEKDDHIVGLVSSYLQNTSIRKEWLTFDEKVTNPIENFKPSDIDEEDAINQIREYNNGLNEMIRILKELME